MLNKALMSKQLLASHFFIELVDKKRIKYHEFDM